MAKLASSIVYGDLNVSGNIVGAFLYGDGSEVTNVDAITLDGYDNTEFVRVITNGSTDQITLSTGKLGIVGGTNISITYDDANDKLTINNTYSAPVSSVNGDTGAVVLTYTDVGAASSGHNHSGVYEPVFSKNSAFNKNFGSTAGTVTQGNDSRLSDARTPVAHTHTKSEITDFAHTHDYLPLTGGSLSGNLTLTAGNEDRYITYLYTGGTYSWRMGYIGSGSGDANYFVIESSGADTVFDRALEIGATTLKVDFKTTPSVNGTLISLSTHNHSGVYEPVFSKNTAFNKNFGSIADTVCQGNDSRLSDARTPTAHTHATTDISSGTLGVARGGTGISSYTAGNYIYASAAATLAQKTPAQVLTDIGAEPAFTKNTAFNKNFGSAAGTVTQGNDSRLSDARTPTAHKTSHATGGSDALTYSDIGAAASSHNHAATEITSGTLATARGGTGLAAFTSGSYFYASSTSAVGQKTPAQVLSDIGAAASSHSHSYLPLAGGTMSGSINMGNQTVTNVANVQTTKTEIAAKYSIEYNATENSLDFVYIG